MHRVYIHATFTTGTTQSDCDEARQTCEKMFQDNAANIKDFSVHVDSVEIEPLTDSSAHYLPHTCMTRKEQE